MCMLELIFVCRDIVRMVFLDISKFRSIEAREGCFFLWEKKCSKYAVNVKHIVPVVR